MRFGLILLVLLFAVAGAVFGALNSQTDRSRLLFRQRSTLAKGAALLVRLAAAAGCSAGCWSIWVWCCRCGAACACRRGSCKQHEGTLAHASGRRSRTRPAPEHAQ